MTATHDDRILAIPRHTAGALLAESIVPFELQMLPSELVWRSRLLLESDETFLQIIPYALLRNQDGTIWSYRRTGGDGRLLDRCSVGVGGHVDHIDDRGDMIATCKAALQRELEEEIGSTPAPLAIPAGPAAWINEQESAIGRVHIGLVFPIIWPWSLEPQPPPEENLKGTGFLPPHKITENPRFELWSRLAVEAITR